MLSFATDLWPLFWTVIGAGALLTVALSLLVATFRPAWLRPAWLRSFRRTRTAVTAAHGTARRHGSQPPAARAA